MLGGPKLGAADGERVLGPVPPATPAEGGGAITLEARDAPVPFRAPCRLLPAVGETEGGGGTTLAVSGAGLAAGAAFTDGAGGTTFAASVAGLAPDVGLTFTVGGGGTTSDVPKIFPIRLLTNDPLPDCVGGGGTTVFEGSGMLPLANRPTSRETSEGGGAITDGDGTVRVGFRSLECSGAETGGGTTATLVICTGALVTSRVTAPGAGGITLAARGEAAPLRLKSRVTVGAGATTEASRNGAIWLCSRDTLGAGGITAGPRAGATSWNGSWEDWGAGGITLAFSVGAVSGWSREKLGAGGTTALIAIPLRV